MRIALLLIVLALPSAAEIGPALFRHHYIARDMPGANRGLGSSVLADFDKDGDLDFAAANRGDGKIYWFEFRGADDWARHTLGEVPTGQLAGLGMDVDGDGWFDVVVGGVWFRNPGTPRGNEWPRFVYDSRVKTEIHDMVAADIDSDGKQDVVVLGDREGCFWYSIPPSPSKDADWPRTTVTMAVLKQNEGIHSGFNPGGVGDLDGDGDADIVLPNQWLENTDNGKAFTPQRWFFGKIGPWNFSSRSWIADVDGDGDNDVLIADSDGQNSGVAWIENNPTRQGRFALPKYFANRHPGTRGSLHSMRFADFDGDGDRDLLVVEQEDPSILPLGASPRWFIFENQSAAGGVRFTERVILNQSLGGHDVHVGDVDGDGDIDIVSKIWSVWKDNANGGKVHLDWLENLTNTRRQVAR